MVFDKVHLNGRCVLAREATISVFDAGFLHGASTFSTLFAHNGVVFRLGRHIERMMETVDTLGLRIAVTPGHLAASVNELIEANNIDAAKIRLMITPGSTLPGDDDTIEPPTVLITAEAVPEHFKTWRADGITVAVSSLKQSKADPTGGYKTGNYLPRYLALREAAAKGAQESLWFTDDHHLCEACFRNVFLVLGGKVFTPPRDTPCLPGIVRQTVIELCGTIGIPCDENTPLTVREMLAAEEVFLSGSVLGICPVVRIEAHAVGNEKPGAITQRVAEAYWELIRTECRKPPQQP